MIFGVHLHVLTYVFALQLVFGSLLPRNIPSSSIPCTRDQLPKSTVRSNLNTNRSVDVSFFFPRVHTQARTRWYVYEPPGHPLPLLCRLFLHRYFFFSQKTSFVRKCQHLCVYYSSDVR